MKKGEHQESFFVAINDDSTIAGVTSIAHNSSRNEAPICYKIPEAPGYFSSPRTLVTSFITPHKKNGAGADSLLLTLIEHIDQQHASGSYISPKYNPILVTGNKSPKEFFKLGSSKRTQDHEITYRDIRPVRNAINRRNADCDFKMLKDKRDYDLRETLELQPNLYDRSEVSR